MTGYRAGGEYSSLKLGMQLTSGKPKKVFSECDDTSPSPRLSSNTTEEPEKNKKTEEEEEDSILQQLVKQIIVTKVTPEVFASKYKEKTLKSIEQLESYDYSLYTNDSLENELTEYYSYSENVDILRGAYLYNKIDTIKKRKWKDIGLSEKQLIINDLFSQLESVNIQTRLDSGSVLLYISLGCGLEINSSDEQMSLCKSNNLLFKNFNGLSSILLRLALATESHRSNSERTFSMVLQENKDPSDFPSLPPNSHPYWNSHSELNQTFNLLFNLILFNQHDQVFIDEVCCKKVDDKRLINFLFDLLAVNHPHPPTHLLDALLERGTTSKLTEMNIISSENTIKFRFSQFFPLKKITVLIRWLLYVTLPIKQASTSCDINSNNNDDSINHDSLDDVFESLSLPRTLKSSIIRENEDQEEIQEETGLKRHRICPSLMKNIRPSKTKRRNLAPYRGQPLKSRREDIENLCEFTRNQFLPVIFKNRDTNTDILTKNSGYFTLKNHLPLATVEALEIRKKYLHETHTNNNNNNNKEEEIKIKKTTDDSMKEDKSTKHTNIIEEYYRLLLPSMRQYIAALLRLLLVSLPNVINNPGIHLVIDLRYNFINMPINRLKYDDICIKHELKREKQVLLKSISFIFLSLLKSFKSNHEQQFTYLRCILQDLNLIILLLKALNIPIKPYLLRNTDISSLTLLNLKLLSEKPQLLHLLLSDSTAPSCDVGFCPRKMITYMNILKLLQKVTKNSPRHIKGVLVRLKTPIILKKSLLINHDMYNLYVLKIFKSQMKYLATKWKKTNMSIISEIYLKVRQDLIDNWVSSEDYIEFDWDHFQEVDKDIRRRCLMYNETTYSQDADETDLAQDERFLKDLLHINNEIELDENFTNNYEKWLENEVYTLHPDVIDGISQVEK